MGAAGGAKMQHVTIIIPKAINMKWRLSYIVLTSF